MSAAGAFSSLVALNRVHLFPVSTWYQLLAAVLIGFTVYFFVLAGIGELTREDVRRIGHSLSLPHRLVEMLARIPWRAQSPYSLSHRPCSGPGVEHDRAPRALHGGAGAPRDPGPRGTVARGGKGQDRTLTSSGVVGGRLFGVVSRRATAPLRRRMRGLPHFCRFSRFAELKPLPSLFAARPHPWFT